MSSPLPVSDIHRNPFRLGNGKTVLITVKISTTFLSIPITTTPKSPDPERTFGLPHKVLELTDKELTITIIIDGYQMIGAVVWEFVFLFHIDNIYQNCFLSSPLHLPIEFPFDTGDVPRPFVVLNQTRGVKENPAGFMGSKI